MYSARTQTSESTAAYDPIHYFQAGLTALRSLQECCNETSCPRQTWPCGVLGGYTAPVMCLDVVHDYGATRFVTYTLPATRLRVPGQHARLSCTPPPQTLIHVIHYSMPSIPWHTQASLYCNHWLFKHRLWHQAGGVAFGCFIQETEV
jgi:hypothetical protein